MAQTVQPVCAGRCPSRVDDGIVGESDVAADAEWLAFLEGRVVEHSRQIDGIREAIDSLDGKVSRQFMWLVGIQVTTLVAIVAALVAR